MQQLQPQQWVHQPQGPGQQTVGPMPPGMSGVGDPNMSLAPPGYGMDPGELGNMDLDLMAYGFGDEFMAMGFGMGIENDGGWAF